MIIIDICENESLVSISIIIAIITVIVIVNLGTIEGVVGTITYALSTVAKS